MQPLQEVGRSSRGRRSAWTSPTCLVPAERFCPISLSGRGHQPSRLRKQTGAGFPLGSEPTTHLADAAQFPPKAHIEKARPPGRPPWGPAFWPLCRPVTLWRPCPAPSWPLPVRLRSDLPSVQGGRGCHTPALTLAVTSVLLGSGLPPPPHAAFEPMECQGEVHGNAHVRRAVCVCGCVCTCMWGVCRGSVCMYMCVHQCVCVRLYVCVCARVHVCVCVCISVCVCMCMCVCQYVCA